MSRNETAPIQIHENNLAGRDTIIMMLPLLVMACYFYGPRPAVLSVVALIAAYVCDRIVAIIRATPYDRTENSSLAIALVIAMMMPATVHYYILIVSVCVAIFVGKAAFGGWGAYPFSPAALGYAIAAVSWEKQVFMYPEPFTMSSDNIWTVAGITLSESSAHTLKIGGMPTISSFNLVLGDYAGPMGATATLVIAACALYLWTRRRISLIVPFSFLGACAMIAFCFPRIGEIPLSAPWMYTDARMQVLKYELLSGALLFASVFLINDPVTLPKNGLSKFIFGVFLGIATMMFRYYGSYDTGVCFALLAANAFSGYIDRTVSRLVFNRKGVRRVEG